MTSSTATGVLETFADLAGKAGGIGHINLLPDPDGRVRSLPLLIQYGERLFPSMALQLAIKYSHGNIRHLAIDTDAFGSPRLSIEHLRLATDPAYRMLVNHDIQWTRKNSYSFVDVLNGNQDPGVFRHKIVLIGPTSDGVAPRFRAGPVGDAAVVELTADALEPFLGQFYCFIELFVRGNIGEWSK